MDPCLQYTVSCTDMDRTAKGAANSTCNRIPAGGEGRERQAIKGLIVGSMTRDGGGGEWAEGGVKGPDTGGGRWQ